MHIGNDVLLDREVATGWNDYPFDIPEADTQTGLVYVDVEQKLPNKDAFLAWEKAFFGFVPPPPEPTEEEPKPMAGPRPKRKPKVQHP
jgi:hypothetical protein